MMFTSNDYVPITAKSPVFSRKEKTGLLMLCVIGTGLDNKAAGDGDDLAGHV